MKSLNTSDFLKSYSELRSVKYPAIAQSQDISHVALATILTVSIEWGKTLDEIQELLDKKTQEQKLELELFQNEKVGI